MCERSISNALKYAGGGSVTECLDISCHNGVTVTKMYAKTMRISTKNKTIQLT